MAEKFKIIRSHIHWQNTKSQFSQHDICLYDHLLLARSQSGNPENTNMDEEEIEETKFDEEEGVNQGWKWTPMSVESWDFCADFTIMLALMFIFDREMDFFLYFLLYVCFHNCYTYFLKVDTGCVSSLLVWLSLIWSSFIFFVFLFNNFKILVVQHASNWSRSFNGSNYPSMHI